jgi:YHS domain-containing protein
MKKIIFILLLLFTAFGFSQTVVKRTIEFNLVNKVAIQGYDPVTYFTLKKAIKGKSNIASTYEGITYYFSSQENKYNFLKNPTSYEPQYGGWCAYAIGNSAEKVKINPNTFKIIDNNYF